MLLVGTQPHEAARAERVQLHPRELRRPIRFRRVRRQDIRRYLFRPGQPGLLRLGQGDIGHARLLQLRRLLSVQIIRDQIALRRDRCAPPRSAAPV